MDEKKGTNELSKKEYQTPKLSEYGTIQTLTRGNVIPLNGMDNPGNQKTG